jgi:hypothetical protein
MICWAGLVGGQTIFSEPRLSFTSTKRIRGDINKKKKMDDVAGLWDEGRPRSFMLGCRLNNDVN